MKSLLLGLAATAPAVIGSAQSTVFDNTGELAPLERGMLIYGAGSGFFSTGGAQFTAPAAFTLDRVELGLWAIANVTSVTASLYTSIETSAGELPDSFLSSATISDVGDNGYYTFDFANEYSFTAGTKLWITVVNTTGTLVWNYNAAGIGGVQQQSFDPDPSLWNTGDTENPQLAFRVSAIPEPATSVALLGACGLLAAFGYRKRRAP